MCQIEDLAFVFCFLPKFLAEDVLLYELETHM